MTILPPHSGKQPTVTHKNITYGRHMVRTDRIDSDSDLVHVITHACGDFLQDRDVICIAESVVAITQNRAYKIADITPGFTARLLSRFVKKSTAGIGLAMPETMQLAVQEVGAPRLFMAAAVAGITRSLGRKGDFYRIAGEKARGIDGPTSGTLPPYNEYATLIPKNPHDVAMLLQQKLELENRVRNLQIIIVDANDIGVNILGAVDSDQQTLAEALVADNPMGQGHEQTPVMIARKI